jgi:hypothetical protein
MIVEESSMRTESERVHQWSIDHGVRRTGVDEEGHSPRTAKGPVEYP